MFLACIYIKYLPTIFTKHYSFNCNWLLGTFNLGFLVHLNDLHMLLRSHNGMLCCLPMCDKPCFFSVWALSGSGSSSDEILGSVLGVGEWPSRILILRNNSILALCSIRKTFSFVSFNSYILQNRKQKISSYVCNHHILHLLPIHVLSNAAGDQYFQYILQ